MTLSNNTTPLDQTLGVKIEHSVRDSSLLPSRLQPLLSVLVCVSASFIAHSATRSIHAEPLEPHEVSGTGGIVTADNKDASEVGAQILREGGDAADAAVATALMLGVLQPFASGIGGGGFAVIYRADATQPMSAETRTLKYLDPKTEIDSLTLKIGQGLAYTLDFREVAPLKAHRDLYLDKERTPIPKLSTVGPLAAGVPGEIAGLYVLHQRHGKLPWARVVEPAIRAAVDGFPMHALLHKYTVMYVDRVKHSPTLARALLDTKGTAHPIGATVRFPELGRTLTQIARRGADGFYKGVVAEELARSNQEGGGIISTRDLFSYLVKARAALSGSYYDYQLISMPPPSSGGAVILQALKALEATTLQSSPLNSADYLHPLVEALKHGFADRANIMGDPDFIDVPIKRMLSAERIKEVRDSFDPKKTLPQDAYGGRYQATPDGGTSHFNVLDAHGNAIALTTTINTTFGSRFVAGFTGVLLNNEMDDFVTKSGVPNAYGLIGKASNEIQPLKRPLSSMSPTIVLRSGKIKGLAGGSGGPTIITGTLQVLLNLIHDDRKKLIPLVGRAVSTSRVHHQWTPNKVWHDPTFPFKSLKELEMKGHRTETWPRRYNSIQAVWVKGETLYGASDPSKGGRPACVSPSNKK